MDEYGDPWEGWAWRKVLLRLVRLRSWRQVADWVLEPVGWSWLVRVGWETLEPVQEEAVQSIAGAFAVSTKLLGHVQGHRRWPSLHRAMEMQMERMIREAIKWQTPEPGS